MMQHPGNVMLRDLILTYLEKEKEWTARKLSVAMKNDGNNMLIIIIIIIIIMCV